MNEEYDAIVMGTGLTECVVSGLLSTNGYKVLHIDRNPYYGGESASLHLDQLFEKFRKGDKPDHGKLGDSKKYYIDLVPKFLMANGKLERMLHLTGVTKYQMAFVKVSKCFVMGKKGKLAKVPATLGEVAKSPLMGMMEKVRCKKLLSFISEYDPEKGGKHDLKNMTMRALYKAFKVDEQTIDFLGHSVALEQNDDYIDKPNAWLTCLKMNLYANSLAKYGDNPFIYPMYGLGELPQVFSRLSAVYGGTYMLDTPITKVNYDGGKVTSVESDRYKGEIAKCKFVVADPSYFPEKCEKKGQIIRVICILNHPIPTVKDADSCQIIIPQKQSGRHHDIYICCTMHKHKVCPQGKYLAIVATKVETDKPLEEVRIALALLGEVEEQFVCITDIYEPKTDGKDDGVYLSKSYDSTTHFESCSEDIISIYERITKKKFDWTKKETEKDKKEKESMK